MPLNRSHLNPSVGILFIGHANLQPLTMPEHILRTSTDSGNLHPPIKSQFPECPITHRHDHLRNIRHRDILACPYSIVQRKTHEKLT